MTLLQMSYAGAVLILLAALGRLCLLRTVPKRTFLFLWALVLVRLLIPFPGLLRLPTLLPEELLAPIAATTPTAPVPTAVWVPRPMETAAPAGTVLPTPQATRAPEITPEPTVTAPPMATAAPAAPVLPTAPTETTVPDAPVSSPGVAPAPRIALVGRIWLIGLCITAAVFILLYALSFRRFRRSRPVTSPEAAAWLEAHPTRRKLRLRSLQGLASPLTYGVFRPVILLPEGLEWDGEETAFALEHEFIHVRRLDALWKLLLAVTLAVHWFNPFVWLLWFLANRDLELSCDEEVLGRLGAERRGDYARALVRMEEKRSLLRPLHAGFGAGTTKERVTAIMKYKKKTVLSVLLAAALVLILTACALGGRTAAGRSLLEEGALEKLSAVAQMDEEGTLYYASRQSADFTEVRALLAALQGKPCAAPEGGETLRFQLSMADGETHELAFAPCGKAGEACAALDGKWRRLKTQEDPGEALASLCRGLCPRPAKLTPVETKGLTETGNLTAETEYPDYDEAHTSVSVILSNQTENTLAYGYAVPFEFEYLGEWYRIRAREGLCYFDIEHTVRAGARASVSDSLDWIDMEPIPGEYRFRVSFRESNRDRPDQTACAPFRVTEEAARVQYVPLEEQSLNLKPAAAEGCCLVTGGEAEPYPPVEEFYEKASLHIPCELRLLYPEEGKVCHISYFYNYYGGYFRAETRENGATETALFPYLVLRDEGQVMALSTYPADPEAVEAAGYPVTERDLLPLLSPGDALAEKLRQGMAADAVADDDVVVQSVRLADTGDMLHILREPDSGDYRLRVGSYTYPESWPADGLHPVHLEDLGGNRVLVTPASPEGETQAQVMAVLDGTLMAAEQTEPGGPGPDLTVGPVRWGMPEKEAMRMLAITAGDGAVVSAEGGLTLEAEFCSCPAEIRWCFCFAEGASSNYRFLNSIEIRFTDPKTFDRETVAKTLEEIWGERSKQKRGEYYTPGAESTAIAPKEQWYWHTEDCSDEYGWKWGVSARFVTDETGTMLRIDASGRNQAAGRLTRLPRNEETEWETGRLLYIARMNRPSAYAWHCVGPWFGTREPAEDTVQVFTRDDLALAERLYAPYPWIRVEFLGDQYREADVSGVVLDGSIVLPAAAISRDVLFEGWRAVFTNQTDKNVTVWHPEGILAERDGSWVRPTRFETAEIDWASQVLAPGESCAVSLRYALISSGYDFVPGRYMMTVWVTDSELNLTDGVSYGATFEVVEGQSPTGQVDALTGFLFRAVYGAKHDSTIRWGEGARCQLLPDASSGGRLEDLLWHTEYAEIEARPTPEGEMPVVLEGSDGTSLRFWRGSELAVLTTADGETHAYLCTSKAGCTGDLVYAILYSARASNPLSPYEGSPQTLREIAEGCTDILVATYKGSRMTLDDVGERREDDFTVVRALKGATPEGPVTVCTDIVSMGGGKLTGQLRYEPGQEYLLLLTRRRSVFFDADQYSFSCMELFLPLTAPGGASACGKPLEEVSDALRADSTGREILDYFEALIPTLPESPEFEGTGWVEAASPEEAMAAAPFVLWVKPTQLSAVGRDGRETCRCQVTETLKGDLGSLGEDILVIFFPGTVEFGAEYRVCVTHSSPTSRLFIPISKEYSVHRLGDEED